jgi:mannosyltransferase
MESRISGAAPSLRRAYPAAAASPARPEPAGARSRSPLAGAAVALPRKVLRSVWLWPTLLTLAIALFQADRAQLWRDELATWSAASRPVTDLLRLVGNIDAVSGPYYLLMHGWLKVSGDSALALRLPSILGMAAAAGLTAVLGRRLFGARTGLVAGLLFAVAPSTSRYAQEARAYALATLLAVLATLLLARALERPTWARWLGYGAAVAGLGLAHLVAVILVAGHAVAVMLAARSDGQRKALRFLAAVPAAGTALVPLALLGRGQQSRQLDWVAQATISELPRLPGGVLQSGAVGGLLVGLAAVGAATRGRWGAALAACVLLPTALLFGAGLVAPLWVPRYLVFTVPLLCLLAAPVLAGLRLPAALLVVAMTAVLGAPEQAGLRRTHEWPRSAPIDYRAASRIISAQDQPGDGIVYHPRDGWKFLDTAVAYYSGADRPRDVLAVRDPRRRASLWAEECDQPGRCLAPVDRVWLLVVGQKNDPLRGMAEPKAGALRADFRVAQVWRVPGLTVALLTRT